MMEFTEEKNNVAPVENDVVSPGNNGSNVFEDCTADNPIDNEKYLFVTKEEVMMLDPMAIHTASPFKDLFPIREKDLKNIEESMKNNGFNSGLPITLWAGHDTIVVDGHTRLAAAQKLLFARIPVILKNFKDEDEALKYAIEMQTNRRNLTDAELINCINELDKRMKEGRPEKTATRVAVNGRSSENTAKLLGTSRGKVEKIRAINDHASDEVKEAVKSGEMSVNMAYNKTMDARRQEENRNGSDQGLAMLMEAQKKIARAINTQIDNLMKKYPGTEFNGVHARTLYREICKELITAINAITNPDGKMHRD